MKLNLFFTDFWSDFIPNNNLLFNILSKEFEVNLTDKNPDIVFFSNFGYNHINFNSKKIYFTGENLIPDYFDYDYAMGFNFDDKNENYLRLPLYAFYDDVSLLLKNPDPDLILKSKSKFCNFIYSNPINKERNSFFRKLNKYKRVDAAGKVLNNTGFLVKNKREFLKDYKFTIAFENESSFGYTTEKLFEPFLSSSLPIYWGNPSVNIDFNSKSFINANDFNNFDDLVEFIIEIDNNDEKYIEYFKQPKFNNNELNQYVNNDNILKFLVSVINSKKINKNFKYFKNNNLIPSKRIRLLSYYYFKNMKRILRFTSIKKPIMKFKTRNLIYK